MQPNYVVALRDLDSGPKEVTWTLSQGWLQHTLAETDATPEGPGELSVRLTKNGREVVVQGQARLTVTMACARSMQPMSITLTPEVFLLLAPAQGPEPRARPRRRGPRNEETARNSGKPAGKSGWADDPRLADEDAARDTYQGETVVLDPFLREFILLDIPMMPVREDLHAGTEPAIPLAPSDGQPERKPAVDPRLAPLEAIARRMREKKE